MRTVSSSESLLATHQSTRPHTAEDEALHKSVSHLSNDYGINVRDYGQGKECLLSGFRCSVDETCAIVVYYAAKLVRVWNPSATCDRMWWRSYRKRGTVFRSLQRRSKKSEVRSLPFLVRSISNL